MEPTLFRHSVKGELLESLQRVFPTQIKVGGGHGRSGVFEYLVPEVTEAKLEIFADEHPPPHFRVTYGGQSANYNLYTGERLAKNRPIRVKDRKIKAWWKEHRVSMAELWNKTRPTDCTVGPMDIPADWLDGKTS